MKISGLTTCVNFASELSHSLSIWKDTLDELIVVTDLEDKATRQLCRKHRIPFLVTSSFYHNGASFNKGAAMNEGVEQWHETEWCLFFDADVEPPPNWRETVMTIGPVSGCLYGAFRTLDGKVVRPQHSEMPGYFHLFHSQDPAVASKPLLSEQWSHAGGVDGEFQARWSQWNRVYLPIRLAHHGVPGQYWWGRHNQTKMRQMVAYRKKTGKFAPNEKMP